MEEQKELILKLKECVSGQKLSAANIVEITHLLMKNVESFQTLKGSEKKEVVIRTLGLIVGEMLDDDEEKGILEKFIQLTLPYMIDALVLADKKGLFGQSRRRILKLCCPITLKKH